MSTRKSFGTQSELKFGRFRKSMWRIAAVSAALAVLVCALEAVRAGVTVFDFEAPAADQQGNYQASPEVLLQSGTASLVEQSSPAWHRPDWSYRLVLSVNNQTGAALIDVPVRVDLEGAPVEVFDRSNLDGSDLIVLDEWGIEQHPRWVERFDFIARAATVWVRLAQVLSGMTYYYLYFGNPLAAGVGSAEAVFTYPAPVTTGAVLSPVAAGSVLHLISFVDTNHIELSPGSVTLDLDTRESGTVVSADMGMTTLIAATGPYYGAFELDGTDAVMPLHAASTTFTYPCPRYSDILDIMAPFGDASVDIYDGSTLMTSQTVFAATPVSIPADVTDGNAIRIDSDVPVLVHRRTDSTGLVCDVMPYLAPDTELVGANSGSGRLVALDDNTTVDIYYSAPDLTSVTLNAGQVYNLGYGGSQGSGEAIHILASGPVAALSYGDGDGNESITFLPRRELGRRYLIARDAQYILVATPQPGVTCEILDANGQLVTTQTGDTLAPHYPNRLYFGATAARSELNCDAPVFAMAEDTATNDERNLWPVKAHRPAFYPALEVDFLPQLQPRYTALEGTVITPTVVPESGVSAFLSFRQTGTTVAPQGSGLYYQLSNDGGNNWFYFDGQQWQPAAVTSQSNTTGHVNANIRDFDVGSGTLTVKAILRSDEGTVTPLLDELTVDYAGPGEPVEFVFDTIDGSKVAGIPFPVTIRALDVDGLPARDFSGTARLYTWGGNTFPDETPPFVEGVISFDVAVSEVGPAVVLVATSGAVTGNSNPFEVVAPDTSSLALELVEGDQQAGTVALPLPVDPMVRVVSLESGYPVPGVEVIFTLLEGGGRLESSVLQGSELTIETDAGGRAWVTWVMGPEPGANRMEVRLEGAQGSPVVFEARADPVDYDPSDEKYWASGGGGCACALTAGQPGVVRMGPWTLLFVLVFVSLLLSRRFLRP